MNLSNKQEKIYVVTKTLQSVNDELKKQGNSLDRKTLKILAKISCKTFEFSQEDFCEIGILVAKNKTIEEINKIMEEKNNQPLKNNLQLLWEKIITFSTKYEMEKEENIGKDIETIGEMGEKNAFKRIRILMKLAKDGNHQLDETNVQTNLEMLLSMNSKKLRGGIQQEDLDFFLNYVHYYNATNKKEPEE